MVINMSKISFINQIFLSNQNEEKSQSMARMVFLHLFYLYYLSMFILKIAPEQQIGLYVMFTITGIHAYANYFWTKISNSFHPKRVLLGIFVDVTSISIVIFYLGWMSLLAYPIYLWIIIGNGMRFGARYMFIAMALSLLEFEYIILHVDFWIKNFQVAYGLFSVLIIMPLFFMVMIKRLQNSNAELKKQLALQKQQEAIIITQSKNAALGEMINNIAHQWRQPLNSVSLIFQNIDFLYQEGELDDESIQRTVGKGIAITEMMSKTIDDFRNFFKPNKNSTLFDCSQIIKNTLSIIQANLNAHDIDVVMDLQKNLLIYGYENEFSQVILNIIFNARDALIEHKKDTSLKIWIKSYRLNNTIVIEIQDNGGGISDVILSNIFDPYFTTKDDDKGTGIGLYMSKMIIEEHMKGSLHVSNTLHGAKFSIMLKSYDKNTQGVQ